MKMARCVIGCEEVFPYELTCPRCGEVIDLLELEDEETYCKLCGYVVFEHERYIN